MYVIEAGLRSENSAFQPVTEDTRDTLMLAEVCQCFIEACNRNPTLTSSWHH